MIKIQRWAIRMTAALLLVVFAWWLIQPSEDAYKIVSTEAFATYVRVTYLDGPDEITVREVIDQELARIDAMASTWRSDSELMRYNRAAAPDEFKLSAELSGLIERAKQLETQTQGAFSLRPAGEEIDLSAIAKGYAVDRVTELLQTRFGITDCLIDIGGEVRAVGDGPGGAGWRVGLYQPIQDADIKPPVLSLQNLSVATSGAYFKGDHIIDSKTGKPVINDLVSASVLHPNTTTADALATALYVMGAERGLAWAKQHSVYVVFLLDDGTRMDYKP